MRRFVLLLIPVVVTVMASSASASASDRSWHGDSEALPTVYSWLSGDTPSDTYAIVTVRGAGVRQVLRTLGGSNKSLGKVTPERATEYVIDHLDKNYEGPPVVQVARHGPAVVIYEPYDFRAFDHADELSRLGTVAAFVTTVELDTYVAVARRGSVIRTFDAGFRPPAKGALPQESGLDWGARHQNIFATAWAFDERVTRIHISQDWFEQTHATYILN